MNETQLQERLAGVHKKINDDIEQYGWSAIYVFGGQCGFCYSVGFTALNHPEMIVYGMLGEQSHAVLDLAYNLVKDGKKFVNGEETQDLCMPPYQCSILAVPGDGYPASAAIAKYGEIKLLQIIWPDRNNNFPWEEDYQFPKEGQPVLFLSPDYPDLS